MNCRIRIWFKIVHIRHLVCRDKSVLETEDFELAESKLREQELAEQLAQNKAMEQELADQLEKGQAREKELRDELEKGRIREQELTLEVSKKGGELEALSVRLTEASKSF